MEYIPYFSRIPWLEDMIEYALLAVTKLLPLVTLAVYQLILGSYVPGLWHMPQLLTICWGLFLIFLTRFDDKLIACLLPWSKKAYILKKINNDYSKINECFGVIECPTTLNKMIEISKELPKVKNKYYQCAFDALKKVIKVKEAIHYFEVAAPKLTKIGFIVSQYFKGQ